MKKINYIFLSLFTLIILSTVLLSCSDEKSGDNTPPTIEDVRFNVSDTILYKNEITGVVDTIRLNDPSKGSLNTDILIIGKPIRFTGRFADNEGLSNAFIHIWGDSTHINEAGEKISWKEGVDTCYQLKEILPFYMFGEQEYIIDSMGFVISNTLDSVLTRKTSNNEYAARLPVRETTERNDKDVYYFSIRCTDRVGNVNVETYNKYPITVMKRKTYIEKYLKK